MSTTLRQRTTPALERAWENSGAWAAKVAQDRAIAARHQTPQQRAITTRCATELSRREPRLSP